MKEKTSQPLSYEKALQKAARLCSKAEKSGQEIRQKLFSWNVAEKYHDKIIRKLMEDGFIDEERFGETFVREKFHLNGWGRIKLRYGLRQKGISEKIIEEVLQVIDEEEYLTKLQDILRKKSSKLKDNDPYKRKAALIRYAAGKGFEENLVHELIDSLLPEEKTG